MNTAIAYAIAGTARPVIDDMSSQSNVHVQRIPVRSMINTTAVQTIMPRNKLVGICPDLSPYFCCCFAYTSHTHSHYPYKIRTKDPSKQFAMMTLIFLFLCNFIRFYLQCRWSTSKWACSRIHRCTATQICSQFKFQPNGPLSQTIQSDTNTKSVIKLIHAY